MKVLWLVPLAFAVGAAVSARFGVDDDLTGALVGYAIGTTLIVAIGEWRLRRLR